MTDPFDYEQVLLPPLSAKEISLNEASLFRERISGRAPGWRKASSARAARHLGPGVGACASLKEELDELSPRMGVHPCP